MNERIKKLRKTLNLTQQEFADAIGVKRGAIANYEINRNEPIDSVISLICRVFNVSEDWLRTGEGDMFIEQSTFSLDAYAKQNGLSDIDIEVIRNFMELDADTRNSLYSLFKNAFDNGKSIF